MSEQAREAIVERAVRTSASFGPDLWPRMARWDVASMEGVMVVERIAGRDVRPVPYDETPNCTYCDPEIGSVGLTEKQAQERDVHALDRARPCPQGGGLGPGTGGPLG